MVVGVAGKYCAGKNTVAAILVEHGYREIDVDKLGHQALERSRDRVAERFGTEVLTAEGTVNRRALGRIVFAEDEAREDLEAIVHPEMRTMTSELIAESQGPVVINAAILFSMKLDALCDTVLWVTAPMLHRVLRARSRDALPFMQIVRRMWTQRRLAPQHVRQNVDIHTVRNSGSRARLYARLRSLELV